MTLNLAWTCGSGPYAVVTWCNNSVSVSRHELLADALVTLARVDRLGCGSRCGRDHRIVHLDDPGGR